MIRNDIYCIRYDQQNKEDIPMEKKVDIILINDLRDLIIKHVKNNNFQVHQELVLFENAQAYPSFIVQYTVQ